MGRQDPEEWKLLYRRSGTPVRALHPKDYSQISERGDPSLSNAPHGVRGHLPPESVDCADLFP